MALVYFGTHKTPINVINLFVPCPYCESNHWAEAMLYSEYFHLFGIPVIPVDKTMHMICENCGGKRYGNKLDKELIQNWEDIKHDIHHPWWTYSGTALTLIFVITIIVANIT